MLPTLCGNGARKSGFNGRSQKSCKERRTACPRQTVQERLVAVRAGVAVFANLFLGPLARQSLFHTTLLTWLQVIRMPLYFLDNVFCLNLTFKPAQRVFQRLAFL